MRGRSHTGSATSDNFWKWRDEMYSLVENISRQQLYEVTVTHRSHITIFEDQRENKTIKKREL